MTNKLVAKTFLATVIRPTCETIGLWSEAAAQLLLGTAIQESGLVYRRQIGGGPALGLFQMEPSTHDDCWQTYLNYRPDLAAKVLAVADLDHQPDAEWLVNHDKYATAMARIKYLRAKEPLPSINNIPEMANYWGKFYNTRQESGKIQQFLNNWYSVMGKDD